LIKRNLLHQRKSQKSPKRILMMRLKKRRSKRLKRSRPRKTKRGGKKKRKNVLSRKEGKRDRMLEIKALIFMNSDWMSLKKSMFPSKISVLINLSSR
jgi:hypothetical protein